MATTKLADFIILRFCMAILQLISEVNWKVLDTGQAVSNLVLLKGINNDIPSFQRMETKDSCREILSRRHDNQFSMNSKPFCGLIGIGTPFKI